MVFQKLEVVNDALSSIGAEPLFQNDYLQLDTGYSSYNGVRFAAEQNENNYLPFDLYVESDSIRIDVYSISESLVWAEKHIKESPESVRETIANLLTGYTILEFCGSPHSNCRLYIFSATGTLLMKFTLRGFFNVLSTWNCEKLLFCPPFRLPEGGTE